LLAVPAQAVPIAPATYREGVGSGGATCPNVSGADNLAPESVSGAWSSDQAFYGFGSWSGSATTSYTPRAEVSYTGTNQQTCASFLQATATITYEFEIMGPAGGPQVHVLLPVTGEATSIGTAIGFLGYRVRPVDPVTGFLVGADIAYYSSYTGPTAGPGSISLSATYDAYMRPGDRARAQLDAGCGAFNGSCSAFIDPLPLIDPSQTIFWNGASVPATSLYSLQFSSNVPEPGSAGLAALGVALLFWIRRRV
jgi:MYXO-CTERM domain-containing protein